MDILPDLQGKIQEPGTTRGITVRAVLTGLLLVTTLCVVTPYTDLVMQASLIACNHLPIGVLTLFVLTMVLVNPLMRRLTPFWFLTGFLLLALAAFGIYSIFVTPLITAISALLFLLLLAGIFNKTLRRSQPFNSAELVTMYVMMLVAAGIPSFGLTAYLFPVVTAPYYFKTPENKWQETFFQYIPDWFGPKDEFTINRFYEGLRPGESIPWGPWIGPLLYWSIFVFALYLVIVCLATILRKQWIERERLSFPLVQLPLEMTREEGTPGGNPFFRNKLVWIGFGIPAAVHTLNAFHYYFPSVPGIELKAINLTQGIIDRPWSSLNPMLVYMYFSVVGFTYLLSQEVGLSLWLFFIIYRLQGVIATATGYQDPGMAGYGAKSFMAHQGAGAFMVIVIYSIWLGRRHFADVLRRAFGKQVAESDADEPLSYRAAFWGMVIGSVTMVAWVVAAGMSLWVALIILALFYMIMVALAKFVAEGGVLFVQASFRPEQLLATSTGTSVLGPVNLTLSNIISVIFMYDLRSFMMPSVLDGYRLSDGPRLNRRSLFKAMAIGIAAGVLVSYVSTLFYMYKIGGTKMYPWFLIQGNKIPYNNAVNQINNAVPTNWTDLGFTSVGAAVCWVLMFMRQRYVGWPLHPIGYAMGCTHPMNQMWFPIMLGWMFKSLILRYGGRRGYVQFRPIFLGLVLGEFVTSGLWVLIDFIIGINGHEIFPN